MPAILAVFLTLAPPALAQDTEVDNFEQILRQVFREKYSSDAQLDAALENAYRGALAPHNRAKAREFFARTLRNPKLPGYLAKAIVPVYRKGMTKDEIEAITIELVMASQVKGLARLPTAKQAQFVQHIVNFMEAAPPAKCKALLLGQASTADSATLERNYVGPLPAEQFDAIGLMYLEAMEAELAGDPPLRSISPEQSKLAEQALETHAIKRLQALNDPGLLKRVATDQNNADPAEVCKFYVAFSKAMLDLPEPYRGWQLVKFVQTMQ